MKSVVLFVALASMIGAQQLSPSVRDILLKYERTLDSLALERDKLFASNAELTKSRDTAVAQTKDLRDQTTALQSKKEDLEARLSAAETAATGESFAIIRRIMTLLEQTSRERESLARVLVAKGLDAWPAASIAGAGIGAPPLAVNGTSSDSTKSAAQSNDYTKIMDALLLEFRTQNRERDVLVRALFANRLGRAGRSVIRDNPLR